MINANPNAIIGPKPATLNTKVRSNPITTIPIMIFILPFFSVSVYKYREKED